jgi:hypothetical protein
MSPIEPLRGALLALLALAVSLPQAAAGGFDREAFASFIDALGGRSEPRLYAYSGTVYDIPTGRLVATVEGYQQARSFPAGRDGTQAFVARRAVLLYRAPGSGELLRVYPDVRASITAPPLGLTRYTLSGDAVASFTLSGTPAGSRASNVPETLDAQREGAAWIFRRVLVPPNPVEQPVEIQETVVQPGRSAASGRIRSVMTKVANNPDFLTPGGRHLLHLSWRPVERWDELPAPIRDFLDREAPGMKALPGSLAESLAALGRTTFPEADSPR